MKRYLGIVLTFGVVFISSVAFSESYKDWQPYKDYLKLPEKYKSPVMEKIYKDAYEAELKVETLPSINGGTVGEYLDKKAATPAIEDLGWSTTPYRGRFEVERRMLLNNSMQLIYRWQVKPDGTVIPVNGKAISITK
jgi:hypothetical protein